MSPTTYTGDKVWSDYSPSLMCHYLSREEPPENKLWAPGIIEIDYQVAWIYSTTR